MKMTQKEFNRRRNKAIREQFWSGIGMVILNLVIPTGAAVLLIPLGAWCVWAALHDDCLFYI